MGVAPLEPQQVLDRFAVAERLQHIRRFVWRDGALRLCASPSATFYELLLGHQALRVGIDAAVPWAIFIRGGRLNALVPYLHRAAADVEHALQTELQAYVSTALAADHRSRSQQ